MRDAGRAGGGDGARPAHQISEGSEQGGMASWGKKEYEAAIASGYPKREKVLYCQPIGPNPLCHRDD